MTEKEPQVDIAPCDGGLLIEWDDWPGLFFRGPYYPEEVEHVA
jgi:hypothetical protein